MAEPLPVTDIIARLATELELADEAGVVNLVGPVADTHEKKALLVPHADGFRGCVVRVTRAVEVALKERFRFERQIHVSIDFYLTENPRRGDGRSSEEVFDLMWQGAQNRLRPKRSFDYGVNLVEHGLLQFPRSKFVHPTEARGSLWVIEGSLVIVNKFAQHNC